MTNNQNATKEERDHAFSAVIMSKRECPVGTLTDEQKEEILKAIKDNSIENVNDVIVRGEPLVYFLITTFAPDILKLLINEGLNTSPPSPRNKMPLELASELLEQTIIQRGLTSRMAVAMKEIVEILSASK